jgi:hypothetical protein
MTRTGSTAAVAVVQREARAARSRSRAAAASQLPCGSGLRNPLLESQLRACTAAAAANQLQLRQRLRLRLRLRLAVSGPQVGRNHQGRKELNKPTVGRARYSSAMNFFYKYLVVFLLSAQNMFQRVAQMISCIYRAQRAVLFEDFSCRRHWPPQQREARQESPRPHSRRRRGGQAPA